MNILPGFLWAIVVKIVSWSWLVSWYSSTMISLNLFFNLSLTRLPSGVSVFRICSVKCSKSLKSSTCLLRFSLLNSDPNSFTTSLKVSTICLDFWVSSLISSSGKAKYLTLRSSIIFLLPSRKVLLILSFCFF